MKDTALHPVAEDYRLEVARVLADLPPGEAEEILDDVEVNLSEVLAELDDAVTSESLRARLGTPNEYAAELRAAAGYPPLRPGGSGGAARFGMPEIVLGGLVLATVTALVGGLGIGRAADWWVLPCFVALAVELINALWLRGRDPGVPEVAALSITRRAQALGESVRTGRWAAQVRFVIGLQSAWWVARAVVVGVAVGALADDAWWGVGAGAAALVASLWLAPRSARDRRLVWAAVPINALVAGIAIGVIASGQLKTTETEYVGGSYTGPQGPNYSRNGEHLLGTANGGPLANIYPFDAQGRPLQGVLLFDQNGRQLGLLNTDLDHSCMNSTLGQYGSSGQDNPQEQFRMPNRETLPFPQPRVIRNANGSECRVEEGQPRSPSRSRSSRGSRRPRRPRVRRCRARRR